MFWFYTPKYNFWPIYEAIQKYYPIGISMDESYSPLYSTYPGRKAFGDLLDDNQLHHENFKTRWLDFTERIQIETQKNVFQSTHPQAPCFSAVVDIGKDITFGDVIRMQDLLIYVSLLGPFYTIIGQNKTALIRKGAQRNFKSWLHPAEGSFPAIHYLVVSPEEEYAATFSLLCQMIEEQFAGYRFVPFSICKSVIPGLEVPYSNEKSNSVFNALFFPSILLNTPVVGDEHFKADDWVKEDYVDDGSRWYAFPPGTTDEQMKTITQNDAENK